AHTGAEVHNLRGHAELLTSLAFSPNSRYLATGSRDGSIIVWDGASGKRVHDLKEAHTDRVNRLAFAPDSNRLASASTDGTVKVWDMTDGKEVLRFSGHRGEVLGVAFSPDGGHVASCGEDRRIRIWNSRTAEERRFKEEVWEQLERDKKTSRTELNPGIRNPEESPIVQVVFSPDGRRLASTTFGKRGQQGAWVVRVWDAETGKEEKNLRGDTGHEALHLAFHDNDYLIVATTGFGVVKWNVVDGMETRL